MAVCAVVNLIGYAVENIMWTCICQQQKIRIETTYKHVVRQRRCIVTSLIQPATNSGHFYISTSGYDWNIKTKDALKP
jgi:hypothetical protein